MKVSFGMPLRQTAGFIESLIRLVGLDWAVPDFSTLCRRQRTLNVSLPYPVSLYDCTQARCVCCPFGNHLAKLPQMAAKRIDRLCALADQQLPDSEHHGSALHVFALHRHEAHRRARRRFADRLGIRGVVLLAFDEWLDAGGRLNHQSPSEWASLSTYARNNSCGLAGRQFIPLAQSRGV